MNEITFGDDALSVTLEPHEDHLSVVAEDMRSGCSWQSPLLALEVHYKALRRTQRVKRYRIDQITETRDGVHVTVGDASRGVSAGLWLSVQDGEMRVLLPPAEVYERDEEMYRVFAVDLLPSLLQVRGGETLLLPVRTGAECHPGDKPALEDRFLIYGEQPRWELAPTLPFCGAHSSEGGLVALATRGSCDAQCRVSTDGRGSGNVGFAASLRRRWIDPVDNGHREFRFCPIDEQADPLVAAAKRIRSHVMEDLGKPTLLERAEESPQVQYLIDAYIMKLFHGVENVGAMMQGRDKSSPISFVNCMTFAEAAENLRRLKNAGVPKILTQSVGWNTRGHDGMYPTRFPVEERIGGEEGFRELIARGNDLGYHMNVHDNFTMNVPHSPDWDLDCVIQDVYGEPLVHGRWGGGLEYASWPLAFPPERLGGHIERVKSLGIRGMYYCDYMEQPLEVNYHPEHGGPRSEHAAGQVRVLEEARRVFGSSATEYGFLPCAVVADAVATCGAGWQPRGEQAEWPVSRLIDRIVPVWQLALHGLILVEARGGATWRNAMNALLYGHLPRDEWSARPGVMPVLTDERIRALKATYDLCIDRFRRLRVMEMTGYCEPEEGVRQSTFEDGTVVRADFEAGELFVNEEKLERPKGLPQ
jgi:hypothetical protein